jgi:hypothetical protein
MVRRTGDGETVSGTRRRGGHLGFFQAADAGEPEH